MCEYASEGKGEFRENSDGGNEIYLEGNYEKKE